MRYRGAARFFAVVREIGLHIEVGIIPDNLDRRLVGRRPCRPTESPDLQLIVPGGVVSMNTPSGDKFDRSSLMPIVK